MVDVGGPCRRAEHLIMRLFPVIGSMGIKRMASNWDEARWNPYYDIRTDPYDYDGNPYYSHWSKCRSPVAWSREWDICSQPLLMRAHRRQQRARISLLEVEIILRNFFQFFTIYVRLLDSTYIYYITAYTTTIYYSLIVIMAAHFPSHFWVEFCFLYIKYE